MSAYDIGSTGLTTTRVIGQTMTTCIDFNALFGVQNYYFATHIIQD